MASNDEDPFASEEEESVPLYSASEDEWDPAKEADVKLVVQTWRKEKVKAAPVRPTRASRRIATRLGKELPPEDEPAEQDAVVVLPDEESAASSSGEEEEEEKPSNKKRKQRARRPAQKRGRKQKVDKDEPIKLTTFTVEELYRKYRPDLAGCSKKVAPVKPKVEVKKETEDDDSSGDDYLVDPGGLDLNSEFSITEHPQPVGNFAGSPIEASSPSELYRMVPKTHTIYATFRENLIRINSAAASLAVSPEPHPLPLITRTDCCNFIDRVPKVARRRKSSSVVYEYCYCE